MSKTYRRSGDGAAHSDGGKHYQTPRYRPDSRCKPHRITAVGVQRDQPDLARLGRAIARAALQDAMIQTDPPVTASGAADE